MFRRTTALKAGIIALTLLGVAGCTQGQTSTPSPSATSEPAEASTPAELATLGNGAHVEMNDAGERYWVTPEFSEELRKQMLLDSSGITDLSQVPEVDFIRYDNADQETWRQCVADLGFPGIWHEKEQYWESGEVPEAQDELSWIAYYTCSVQYPYQAHPPYNEEDIRRLYEWQVNTAMPCLAEHGINLPDPPSVEQYADEWFTSMTLSPGGPATIRVIRNLLTKMVSAQSSLQASKAIRCRKVSLSPLARPESHGTRMAP